MKKGISPIIAAVILIAITMAIAGFMSVWANNLTSGRLEEANTGALCIGAYDVDSLTFSGGVVSFRVKNTATKFNITGLKGSIEYTDLTKSALHSNIALKSYNLSAANEPLAPGDSAFYQYNTNDNTTPSRVKVSITACPKLEQSAEFS